MSIEYSNEQAYTENSQDTVTRTPELRAGIISSVILAFIVVCLRVYTRQFIVKRFGPDDYLVGVAMVCSICMILFLGIDFMRHWPIILEMCVQLIVHHVGTR